MKILFAKDCYLNIMSLLFDTEPVCAVGLGVCALLSAVRTDSQHWVFRDIALTGVRICGFHHFLKT